MRVVPERAGSLSDEPVEVLLARADRVLGDTRHPIHRFGHVDAVPVQRDTARYRLVDQPHLHQLSFDGVDDRAG